MDKELIKLTPIEALRRLTGIIDPNRAVLIIGYVNLLARYLDKCDLLEVDFLKNQFRKIGIDLILEELKLCQD